MERAVHDNGSAPAGSVLSLEHRACGALRKTETCLSCLQVKDPRRMKFPLKSVESSEFNEVVQIDHQKICMTDWGNNQILVIIDHFTKLAEAVPCQTASAEETCDILHITVWLFDDLPIG